jgi:pimeloyl-ACP methyl ester carboxylesterase
MRRTSLLLILTVALSLLSAPGLAARQPSPQAATPAAMPTTPVGAQLSWMLGELEDGAAGLTPDEVTEHFVPEFFGVVPLEQAVALTQQVATALGDFTFIGFTRTPLETQANALLIAEDGMPWVAPLSVEASAPHRITGLNFGPVPVPPGIDLPPAILPDGTPVAGQDRMEGFFEVGEGRQIYLSCTGTGSPTVILESGLGDPAALWYGIETAVSGFTRVCSYDRPGTIGGASDPAEGPRTGDDVVVDLHALMQAAGVPGPYVVVGHSIGGTFARLYAHTYPDDVGGLVLVDSSHEDQQERLMELLSPELQEQFEQMMASNPEGIDLEATFEEVRAAREAGPLPAVPLFVVTAGLPADPSTLPPGWPAEEYAAVWQELQADLATLVPGGRQVIAEQSSHYVHQTEPELVVDAIEQVVMAVRDPATWATPAAATPAP